MSLNNFKSAVNLHSSVERRWEEDQFRKEGMFFIGDVMVQAILTDEIVVENLGDRIITTYEGKYKCHRGVVYTIIAEGDDIRITAKREIGDAGEEELLAELNVTNNGWDTDPYIQDLLDKLFETLEHELEKKKGRYI